MAVVHVLVLLVPVQQFVQAFQGVQYHDIGMLLSVVLGNILGLLNTSIM